jgi:class 3 adenylate cyclase/tetratricopeptide (TPR) repeat protein
VLIALTFGCATMECISCHAVYQPDAAYCSQCGAVVGWACMACERINAAGSNFCVGCGAARSQRDATSVAALRPPHLATEFRQVTFMYVDLVGSTELSGMLEPEAYSDVIVRYRDAVGPRISANGGTIARFTGDGILAYFGYPKAAANDPARAVYAALEAVEALHAHTAAMPDGTQAPLEARIGVHTGMTVVGDLEGAGVVEANAAVGHAANVAARIQAAAAPGRVAISDVTWRLVEPHFHTRPMGLMSLKGVSHPTQLHEVVAPTNVSRGLRRPLRHGAAIRGREVERAVLREKWRQATLSRGSAIVISGEAGIGKSRLVRDFLEDSAVRRSGRLLVVECLEQRTISAFQPFRELLMESLGAGREDTPTEVERKLGEALEVPAASLSALRHFLLGTVPDTSISPAKMREDLIDAWLAWINAEQKDRPLALLVEDLHWADDSTLMLLERIISGAEAMKLLVLATARDEFTAPIAGDFRLSKLRLPPLDPSESREVLLDFAAGSALPEGTLEMLVQRAGGNPLFLEELAHTWLERLRRRQVATPDEAVPPSLRDALMERVDRLGRAKGLAQLAAVLGQTFPVGLLEACESGDIADVRRDLAQLVEASILRRRLAGADDEYEFRHALVREVAHESVLPRARAAYHLRIAEVIRDRFPEIADRTPEVLAWHLEYAGQRSDAIDAWLSAGRGAAAQSANVEALSHLDHAIALLRQTDGSLPARRERTLDVLLAMGGPLIAQHGWAADPVDAVYREAIDICQSLGDERKLFNVLRGRQNVLLLRGDLAKCQAISYELLKMAERRGEDVLFLEARRGLGVCAFLAGRFHDAIRELDLVIDLFDPALHGGLAAVYGVNPGVVAMSWRAWASCFVGQPGVAAELVARATALARMASHPFSEGYALCFAASISQHNGEVRDALRYSDLAIDLAQHRGYPYWRAWAGIVRGWAKGAAGEVTTGLEDLDAALGEYESLGARMIVGYAHALAADVAIRGGAIDLARRRLKAAEDAVRETGMKYCEVLLAPLWERVKLAPTLAAGPQHSRQ